MTLQQEINQIIFDFEAKGGTVELMQKCACGECPRTVAFTIPSGSLRSEFEPIIKRLRAFHARQEGLN